MPLPTSRVPTIRAAACLAACSAFIAIPAPRLPAQAAAPPARMTVVAGQGTAGFADGVGAAARFNKPIRLAPFGSEGVLVSDIFNHAIRLVSKDGRVTTIAGAPDRKGHQDGPASEARFASPHGVGVSPDGRIAVAEAEGHTLRLLTRRADGGFDVSTLAGVPGTSGAVDGPAKAARFNSPHAALWGDDGSLYAPDIGNATIRRVKDGQVTTVAGAGGDKLVYPMDIAWVKDGMVIADAGANLLRTWRPGGGGLGTLGVKGTLATPHGVAGGPDGTCTWPT